MSPVWMIVLFFVGVALLIAGGTTASASSFEPERSLKPHKRMLWGIAVAIVGLSLVVLAAALYVAWLVKG